MLGCQLPSADSSYRRNDILGEEVDKLFLVPDFNVVIKVSPRGRIPPAETTVGFLAYTPFFLNAHNF